MLLVDMSAFLNREAELRALSKQATQTTNVILRPQKRFFVFCHTAKTMRKPFCVCFVRTAHRPQADKGMCVCVFVRVCCVRHASNYVYMYNPCFYSYT